MAIIIECDTVIEYYTQTHALNAWIFFSFLDDGGRKKKDAKCLDVCFLVNHHSHSGVMQKYIGHKQSTYSHHFKQQQTNKQPTNTHTHNMSHTHFFMEKNAKEKNF